MFSWLTDVDATLIAAVIAAGAALVGVFLTAWGNDRARREAAKSAKYNRRFAQLNELYAPIVIRRGLSKLLWVQLTGDRTAVPGVTKWKLIDHIEEIKSEQDPRRREIVERILEINQQISTLILKNGAHLNELPPPDSVPDFLEHAATLETLWKVGTNADAVHFVEFPAGFDDDLDGAVAAIQKDLRKQGNR